MTFEDYYKEVINMMREIDQIEDRGPFERVAVVHLKIMLSALEQAKSIGVLDMDVLGGISLEFMEALQKLAPGHVEIRTGETAINGRTHNKIASIIKGTS